MRQIHSRALAAAKELFPHATDMELAEIALRITGHLFNPPAHQSLAEFAECLDTMHPIKGLIPFEVRPHHKLVLGFLDTPLNVLIRNSRQMGGTTMMAMFALREAITKPDYEILYLTSKFAICNEVMSKIVQMYQSPDLVGMPRIIGTYGSVIAFENQSLIRFASIQSDTVFPKARLAIHDDCAYFSHSRFNDYWATVDLDTTRVIFNSTPNTAQGLFYEKWKEVNDWLKIDIPWNLDTTRTSEWMLNVTALLGADDFRREYECQFKK